MLATRQFHASSGKRPWTFYALASLFGAYLVFLYGPMLVMYLLSFQGPNGGVTFPMVGVSTVWFEDSMRPGQMANIPVAFERSIALASIVSLVTMVVSVAAGLGFRRTVSGIRLPVLSGCRQPRHAEPVGRVRDRAGLQSSRDEAGSFHLGARCAADLDMPFGLFAMFAVVNRFDRSYEEAASDLGASAWQRLRHVILPILLPGIVGVGMGAFTLSYDEYARTTLAIGSRNTLPLEIYALISSATSPTLLAIGTVTTTVSFCAIGVTVPDAKGSNAVRHQNSMFHAMLKHLPWGEFERLVGAYAADQRQRGFRTKTQLVALIYGQLSGATSLREIEAGLSSHATQRYHLGIGRVRRSSLAEANAHRPSGLFCDLFTVLVKQAQRGVRRKLDGTTHLIDSTSVALNRRSKQWASFSAEVCGAKVHVVYDPEADQPVYAAFSTAKVNDITAAKAMPIEGGCDVCVRSGLLRLRVVGQARRRRVPDRHPTETESRLLASLRNAPFPRPTRSWRTASVISRRVKPKAAETRSRSRFAKCRSKSTPAKCCVFSPTT